MERTEARLLEEWRANLDLLKFYETLKQQRFAHFLTIQTAFLAIFGLLAKEAIGVFSLITMATLVVIPIPPLVIAVLLPAPRRARPRVRGHGQHPAALIEDEWKTLFPDNHFSTYQQQFAVLSRRDRRVVDRYLAARALEHDQYARLIEAPSAHASETAILRLFWWLWIIVFSFSALHLGWHLAFIPSGVPGKGAEVTAAIRRAALAPRRARAIPVRSPPSRQEEARPRTATMPGPARIARPGPSTSNSRARARAPRPATGS